MTYKGPNAVLQLTVSLYIGGASYPVVSAIVEYALNQIPVARVQLPAGMDVDGKFVDMTQILGSADSDCSLVVSGEGLASILSGGTFTKSYPEKTFSVELFKGRLLSYSASISTTGASIDVVLVDKLYGLDSSSFASGDFDKSAPDDWFTLDETVIANKAGGVIMSTGQRLEDVDFVNKDWWSGIIQPAMIYKAGLPLSKFTDKPPANTANAIEQLKAIKGSLTLTTVAKEALQNSSAVQRNINGAIGNIILTGEGGSSAFEKLLSIATMFGCVIVPCSPGNVFIVPYSCMYAVRSTPQVTINRDVLDFGSKTPNPVIISSGIVLVGSGTETTKASDVPPTINTGFVGKYVIDKLPGLQLGPLMVERIPEYLTGIVMDNIRTDSGTLEKKLSITSLSSTPPVGPPSPPTGPSKANKYADLFAQMRYFTRLYEANTQDVLAGFRLDITPGLTLRVFHIDSDGANQHDCIGVVESVSYVFSQSRISTSCRLRHALGKVEVDAFKGLSSSLYHTLFKPWVPPTPEVLWGA